MATNAPPTGLSPRQLPRHVALIMDGNGRWAKERGLPRVEGHKAGVGSVRAVTEESLRLGIRQITLYTFSAQNWGRPRSEIRALMDLLERYLVDERDELMEHGIRLVAIGRRNRLPRGVARELLATEKLTARNQKLTVCLALDYAGRDEIVDAVRAIADEARRRKLNPSRITEMDAIVAYLQMLGTLVDFSTYDATAVENLR